MGLEQRVSFSTNKLWGWLATAYLIGVPCLWWTGLIQDRVQGVAWHLGAFALFGVSLLCESQRVLKSYAIGVSLLCALIPCMVHAQANGYTILTLNLFIAAAVIVCLITKAPNSDWLIRRVKCLFWINAGYALMQRFGLDPLFENTAAGMFSRINQLSALLLVAVPFVGRAGMVAAIVFFLLLQSWTGILGTILLLGYRELKNPKWNLSRIGLASLASAVATGLLAQPAMWRENVVPRIETWKHVIKKALWSPFFGYGNTVGNFADAGINSWTYSVPVGAFYAIGVLGILACLVIVRWVVKSHHSTVKEAMLLFMWACLFQSFLDFPRMILLGCCLLAALEIKNQEIENENRRSERAVPSV